MIAVCWRAKIRLNHAVPVDKLFDFVEFLIEWPQIGEIGMPMQGGEMWCESLSRQCLSDRNDRRQGATSRAFATESPLANRATSCPCRTSAQVR
jgi:hypothetical protein